MSDDPRRPDEAPDGVAAPAPAAAAPPAAPAVAADAPAAAAAPSAPRPEIALEPGLPGAHRGGFSRLPTAPVDVTMESAPAEPGAPFDPSTQAEWLVPQPDAPRRGVAAWALAAGIIGLLVSFVVGWGFPIGLVGAVTAIIALRRPLESRGVAIWALVLSLLSVIYSAGWLWYAASTTDLLG